MGDGLEAIANHDLAHQRGATKSARGRPEELRDGAGDRVGEERWPPPQTKLAGGQFVFRIVVESQPKGRCYLVQVRAHPKDVGVVAYEPEPTAAAHEAGDARYLLGRVRLRRRLEHQNVAAAQSGVVQRPVDISCHLEVATDMLREVIEVVRR